MTDVHKLTGAYATDALDDAERAAFEQHVATCEDCRAEVQELLEAAARLAETSATSAPASLRSSVLAGISQVRPLPPLTPEQAPATDRRDAHELPADSGTHTDAPADAPVPIHRAAERRGLRRWAPLLVAAVLALVAGVGITALQPWQDDRTLSAAEQVMQAPDAEEVVVDLGDSGRAKVVRSKSEDRAVIITEDMAPAPEGRVFELWLKSPEDEMVPAGLMPPGEDQTVVLEGSAAEATAVGITVEPQGGSDEPTTEPIALFDLTQAT